ncbi:MAG: SiaB family protein kinase [Bacteroidia bacterium]
MNSATDICGLYETMHLNRISMIYQGHFDQEMVKAIMSLAEKKIISDEAHESLRKKVFNVMIEGLQNICKHQLVIDGQDDHSLLVLGKEGSSYTVITGNLIENESVEKLTDKLNFINRLSPDELKEYYKKKRLESVISDVGGAGLGFIDIVRKSGNPLEFKFYPVTDKYSFFVMLNIITNK